MKKRNSDMKKTVKKAGKGRMAKMAATRKPAGKTAKREQSATDAIVQRVNLTIQRSDREYDFLEIALFQLNGMMEYSSEHGHSFLFGRGKHTASLVKLLSPEQGDALEKERRMLSDVVIMLGRIASAIQSPTFTRLARLRMEMLRLARSDSPMDGEAVRLAHEVEDCHDIVLAEKEMLDVRRLCDAWAPMPIHREEFQKEWYRPTKGIKPREATRRSRETALRNHTRKMAAKEIPAKIEALKRGFFELADKAKNGAAPAEFEINIDMKALDSVLSTNTDITYTEYLSLEWIGKGEGECGKDWYQLVEKTEESRAKDRLRGEMVRYFEAALALAQKIASPAADGFKLLLDLLEECGAFFGAPERDQIYLRYFLETLPNMRRRLRADLATANDRKKVGKFIKDAMKKAGQDAGDEEEKSDIKDEQVQRGLEMYRPGKGGCSTRKAARNVIGEDTKRGIEGGYTEINSLAQAILREYNKGKSLRQETQHVATF